MKMMFGTSRAIARKSPRSREPTLERATREPPKKCCSDSRRSRDITGIFGEVRLLGIFEKVGLEQRSRSRRKIGVER